MKRTWQYSRIGRIYTFSAAHRLLRMPEDHQCYRLHGHNYRVEVEVRGDTFEPNGFCAGLDFAKVDKLMNPIIKQLDHQYLNDIIDNPTAENIAEWILKAPELQYLHSVKVWETDRCWAMAVNGEGLYHGVHKE
jgi:6-pyruvoyltetrahydropterin/6-carboxytetrahydropterin synthase